MKGPSWETEGQYLSFIAGICVRGTSSQRWRLFEEKVGRGDMAESVTAVANPIIPVATADDQ